MLSLIIGKAGAGKTGAVIGEIADAVKARQGRRILIVPEQYSHEAERELCRSCGDSLSLYAEVLSFTGLARKMSAELGGAAAPLLDKGGRLLCMALALEGVGSRLKIYSAAARKPELQLSLLSLMDEIKSACVSPGALEEAAAQMDDSLGDKLRDLALISQAYDAVVERGHADPSDRLSLLARQIEDSSLDESYHIYVDGFIDFTAQQRRILHALLGRGVELTVCLTLDDIHGDNEIFELSRRAARALISSAREQNVEYRIRRFENNWGKDPSLSFYVDKMFSYGEESWQGECRVSLHTTESMAEECEFAAAKALELVREKGARWRDIAVAVRGCDSYRSALQNAFEQYGVPLFITKKTSLLSKPLPLLISLAYEILERGWDVDDVISYMHTGLAGLDMEEREELESYLFKWQLRGSAWERASDWMQHPEGYGAEKNEESDSRLERINALRRRLAAPLLVLKDMSDKADTALSQAQALAGYFEALELPQLLEKRADELAAAGREELAGEYAQLWAIVTNALEQSAAVLGDMPMDREAFGRLFTLMLSEYDVGTIPVSLDSVSAGDFDRMRRRSIKHLIVLGADDSRLPRSGEEGGIFSQSERQRLLEMEIDLGGAGEDELWREFTLIYNTLSLPSESLMLCCSLSGSDGEEQRPAFVFRRAGAIFAQKPRKEDMDALRCSAATPALSLAARAMRSPDTRSQAAREYFALHEPGRCEKLERAAKMDRGRLSPDAVRAIYGRSMSLSASKIDRFAQCKFAYFCQYGLRAKPHQPASFTPPEIGTFMHYILENCAREVKAKGGWLAVDDKELGRLCDKYVERYIHEQLNDMAEKSARFEYLFRRLCRDVRQILADMAAELRLSDFEPLDFELNFSEARLESPLIEDGEGKVTLGGIADRVDGWMHEGKLYLRVVDYKTGKKKFSMSDLWYGMGLQMLLYLFTLEERGKELYGHEVVPAGVMYVPARNAILSAQRDLSDEEAESERSDELRRSGLVLDDRTLMEAWEKGEDKRFIPVKFRNGNVKSEYVASTARMGLLSKHIKKLLCDMSGQLRQGNIAADPYYRGQQENACMNCDYFEACHFAEGENGESSRYQSRLRPETVWAMLEGGEDNG